LDYLQLRKPASVLLDTFYEKDKKKKKKENVASESGAWDAYRASHHCQNVVV
jgi:hypothetical protein